MGVYHFMGLGRAVGAVTCAVDYIEKAIDLNNKPNPNNEIIRLFSGSGGINHDENYRGKIEAIVLFTSEEVINGKLPAYAYENCDSPGSVRDEVIRNLKKTWQHSNHHEGRKIFWVEVDIDDFQDCFKKVIKVARRFSPDGKQGKEIWCNLTGGSNSIGQALLSMSGLTGKSNKQYLISQRREYQKAVKVPSGISIRPNKDKYFNILPFWKTRFDMIYFYEILLELDELDADINTRELLSRLQTRGRGSLIFQDLSIDDFIRTYMMSLYSQGYTNFERSEQPGRDKVKISEEGKDFLNQDFTMTESFILEELLSNSDPDIVNDSKNGSLFIEENLDK